MAIVFIPSLMRKHTGGRERVEIPGSTVREIIDNLEREFPGMKERLVENNRLKPNISVAVGGEVSTLRMLEKVSEDSEVPFLPAIGGGTSPN